MLVALYRLQHVRVMAENDIGTGIDQLMALALEVLRGLPDELVPGVESQNDLVGMWARVSRSSAMIGPRVSVTL